MKNYNMEKFCKFIFWRPPRVNTPKKFSMVIYDQRTAISVTRLSANAFLIFSLSLISSQLFLFIGLLQNLHIYTHIRFYHIRCFSPWRRPFRKHTKPGRICTDICCSPARRGESFHSYFGVVFSSDTQKVLKTAHRYLLLRTGESFHGRPLILWGCFSSDT